MKKAIAILLACIMLLGCAPIMSFAADTAITADEILSTALVVASGDKLTVSSVWTLNAPLTINEGATLVVDHGGYITIATNGQIINNGTLIVEGSTADKLCGAILSKGTGKDEGNASFINNETGVVDLKNGSYFRIERGTYAYNKGTINNIDRMTVEGTLNHWVVYPQNTSISYTRTEMWNRQPTTVNFTVSHVNDSVLDEDTGYTVASNYDSVPASGGWCEHGVKEYILITPQDGDGDWVDTGRMQLVVNGTVFDSSERIDNDRGVFTIIPVGSMNIEIRSFNYKDIVKLFEIELPKTEGYYVKAKDGEVDSITVEYGKTFSFTVVLNEDYDKSDFYAYANGVYLVPDEYGYFDITGPIEDYSMATTGGVQNDITITIMGVASNASKQQMTSIVDFIKEIFETIMSIFSYFGDLFTGLGSSLGVTTE